MNHQSPITRRTMLTASAAAIAAPNIARSVEPTKDPVRVGHIGAGTRGWDLIRYTGGSDAAKVVAVCDVYGPHVDRGIEAGKNPDAKRYTDYHDLLADPDVEAVVIATPDHWHERMVIDAVHSGKAVYCEKGFTTSIAAAKRMRDAVKKSNTVFQLGHQGRQFPATKAAGKRIEDGELGPVTLVKTGRYFNGSRERAPWRWYGYYNAYDRPVPAKVIQQLDWEKWLGPAPAIDFNERHFWHWRCYWPYGTGQAGDLLSHELDHVQCVLRWGIPDTCMCCGHNAVFKDDREVPDTWLAQYTFERHDCSLTFEGCMNSGRQQPPEYIGKHGRLVFNGIAQDASDFYLYEDGPAFPHMAGRLRPTDRFNASEAPKWRTHMHDFLHCVRTGDQPRCNVDEAFIEVATFLMSVVSYHEKRQVRWDAEKEEII